MRREQASLTAQRVAAQRALFARVPADHGDPAADDRLGRDVAGDQPVDPQSPMFAYLAARTRFFNSVVVRSLQRGVTQVVIAGAGYDGRALRYAKPGVSWFEVDHPATQADKLERLTRLDLPAAGIAFVAADFAVDDVAGGLAAAGQRPDVATLFLCEGVAVYLETDVLEETPARAARPGGAGEPAGDQPLGRRRLGRAPRAFPGEGHGGGRAGSHRAHRRRRRRAARGHRVAGRPRPNGDRREERAARAGLLLARPG